MPSLGLCVGLVCTYYTGQGGLYSIIISYYTYSPVLPLTDSFTLCNFLKYKMDSQGRKLLINTNERKRAFFNIDARINESYEYARVVAQDKMQQKNA